MGPRALLAALAVTLQAVAWVLVPPPASAAVTQLRFATVYDQLVVAAGQEGGRVTPCPAGFRPASGGFTNDAPATVWRVYDFPNYASNSWEWGFLNGDGAPRTFNLKLLCVLGSQVGTLSGAQAILNRNTTTGRAQGSATCPAGTRLLGGGADWTYGGERSILAIAPLSTTQLYVSGYSGTTGAQLFVDIACTSVDIGSQQLGTLSNGSNGSVQTVEHVCNAGMRVLSGGVNLNGQVDGLTYASNPVGRGWAATIQHAPTGSAIINGLCVPGSVPSVAVVSGPVQNGSTNDASPTLSFTASDPMGEQLTFTCKIDAVVVYPCQPNADLAYGNLADGSHQFDVYAANGWASAAHGRGWFIDTVAPVLTAKSPVAEGLTTDPVTITTTEQVFDGATPITIAPSAGGAAVAYTSWVVGNPDNTVTKTMQPTEPLLSGAMYTVTVPPGLKDFSGNSLAPTSWEFRAIEHTPPTVVATSTTLALTGPVTATFSEFVKGVSPSSFYLRADGATTNSPAGVTTAVSAGQTVATLRPTSALVPGRWYTAYLTAAINDASDNALTAQSWRLRAATTLQSDSPAVTQRWDVDSNSIASGGTYATSATVGSTAALTFNATSGQLASLYGIKLPTGGSADVWLDGVKTTTVSTKNTSAVRAKLFTTTPLGAGAHTLLVKVVSGWASIDSVTVGSTTYQDTAFKQSFVRAATASASGGAYQLAQHTKDADARPSFAMQFSGTGVKVYATKSSRSGTAYVYMDGTLLTTVNLNQAATAYKQLVFSKALASGTHRITVVPVGTASGANSNVGVDYFVVT